MISRLVVLSLLAACGPRSKDVGALATDYMGIPIITAALGDPLPVDPSVRQGVLGNGLTWYVEENARPTDRAELRLVVRAGSVLEDDDQRGLAHFVEHMAFNGTEHFPGNELVDYLQSIGMRFGAHLNAYTSFDETVYMLQVPTDDPELLRQGLLVLADWAGSINFDRAQCEAERGVVLEEWRLGQGLQQRIQNAMMPVFFHESRYAARMPIGTEESLTTFDCDAAERFWRDWYRPDLMAVMAVGDFDGDDVVVQITERFGGLGMPEAPRDRVYYRVPDHEEQLVTVIKDAEIPQAAMQVAAKVDEVQGQDHEAYRRFLLSGMVFGMINERFGVISQDPDAAFVAAGMGSGALGHERAMRTLQIQPRQGRELEALERALIEVERARRWGFTEGELDRARKESMRGMQAYWDERETSDSSTHIEEITRVFLTDEPMPGIPYEYALALEYLPRIDIEAANVWARANLFSDTSQVAMLLGPDRESWPLPDEQALVDAMARVADAEITPPEAEGELPPLVTGKPDPGTISEIGRDDALGTITWRLANGATVILKPTDFLADQIVFDAFSSGGLSRVAPEDFASGATMLAVLGSSGLGALDAITMSRVLAGHGTRVTPYVIEGFEGLQGGGSAWELPTTLQLVHQYFAAPRFDPRAFRLEQEARIESVRNRDVNPESRFYATMADTLWQGHARATPWSVEELESMDLATQERLYRERFGNIGDFTFVFAGNIDLDKMREQVGLWLASLPGEAGEPEQPIDREMRRAPGVHIERISRAQTPRTHVRTVFHGDFEDSYENRAQLRGMIDLLEDRLLEVLREELGGTYGVGVGGESQAFPVGAYEVSIDFECEPSRAEEMIAAMWQVIDEVAAGKFSDEAVASVREQRRRGHETNLESNSFWVSAIAGAMRRGEDPAKLFTWDARNEAITRTAVADTAKRLLSREQYVQIVQAPDEEQ